MLVLSRKIGERILIGSGIQVVVLTSQGNRVRLGVEAPSEIPVHREEVAQRLEIEYQASRCGTKADDSGSKGLY